MNAVEQTSYVLLYVFVIAAARSDVTRGRISNRLIGAGLAAALIVRLAYGGWSGWILYLCNISFPVVTLFSFYLIGAIGAGDIKLFSLIGGFINFTELARCMGFSFVAAAVASLVKLLMDGNFRERIRSGSGYLLSLFSGNRQRYEWKRGEKGNLIPFSLAVLAGLIAATAMRVWKG